MQRHEPIAFLTRQEARLAELTADWGKEAQQECRIWFDRFRRSFIEIDENFHVAVDELRSDSRPDVAADIHALMLVYRDQMYAEIKIFHQLVEETLMRVSGEAGGVQ